MITTIDNRKRVIQFKKKTGKKTEIIKKKIRGLDYGKKAAITICRLAATCRKLYLLLGPSNQSFWQSFVLNHFDFTCGETLCFHDFPYHSDYHGPNGDPNIKDPQFVHGGIDCDEEEYRQLNSRRELEFFVDLPILSKDDFCMFTWKHEKDEIMEDEEMTLSFRKSQFGFLSDLQAQKEGAEWPQHEDAFTLYQDIIYIVDMYPDITKPYIHNVTDEEAIPWPIILAAPIEPSNRNTILDTIGYHKFLWQNETKFPLRKWNCMDFVADPPQEVDPEKVEPRPARYNKRDWSSPRLERHFRKGLDDMFYVDAWDTETIQRVIFGPIFFLGQRRNA
ncbi:hypothetical protein HDU76_005400, partial [Blyttiomyces sp. JEL0837]